MIDIQENKERLTKALGKIPDDVMSKGKKQYFRGIIDLNLNALSNHIKTCDLHKTIDRYDDITDEVRRRMEMPGISAEAYHSLSEFENLLLDNIVDSLHDDCSCRKGTDFVFDIHGIEAMKQSPETLAELQSKYEQRSNDFQRR